MPRRPWPVQVPGTVAVPCQCRLRPTMDVESVRANIDAVATAIARTMAGVEPDDVSILQVCDQECPLEEEHGDGGGDDGDGDDGDLTDREAGALLRADARARARL